MKTSCEAKLDLILAMATVGDADLRRIALVIQRELPTFGGVVLPDPRLRRILKEAIDEFVRAGDETPKKKPPPGASQMGGD